ncbi:MAG: CCA tRNA nucleotidyltransferase, partial [Thermodesulfobacteriota bacterium]|nr:CCA tRNA nucleotidyltransferase [Thermodesulfobacteriota bacterium]
MTKNTIELAKKASKAEHIIEKLETCGYRAYIVGGAVRDMILDESILDFDIVTDASLNEIQAIFHLIHKKKKVKKVGSTFKICIVNDIEVAASRSDDLQSPFPENDLGKRDFTMNSMAYDLFSDRIIDPFSGQEDLKQRIIRFTKSPEMRIKEDPLRMVRACRFVSKIKGKIDPASLDAIKRHKDLIPEKVAMERIRLEILKAMEYEKPSMFFQALHRTELLEHIFPSLDRCFDLDGGPHHGETVFEHCMLVGDALSPKKPLLRIAGYLHDAGKYDAAEFKDGKLTFPGHEKKKDKILADLKNLKFSREEIKYIDSIITVHMRPLTEKSTPKAIRRILVLLEKHQLSYHDFLR